jgi:hypothetical protein
MSPAEIEFIWKHASVYGVAGLVVAAIAYLIGRHAVASYLSEKGKNLATREDIERITDLVEKTKAPYNELLEELRARHQLRLAAIDRRLQAHQESFVQWRKLMAAVHTAKVGAVVGECQSFWEANCLYLEPAVRESFVRAYSAAHLHSSILSDRSAVDAVKQNWREITQFPEVLFAAVSLPALSELERKAATGELPQ